jgi:hypothetical protein
LRPHSESVKASTVFTAVARGMLRTRVARLPARTPQACYRRASS